MGVGVGESWVIIGVQVRGASSGGQAASVSRDRVGVCFVVGNPVCRVRREWQVIKTWFPNANTTRWGVVVVLE